MARRRPDLPLEKDGSGRFLPWLIALMVYLACLSLAGSITLSDASERWRAGLTGTLTVQIAAPEGSGESEDALAVAAALDVLRATPGIESARRMPRDEVVALIEPWLGRGNVAGDLPVPTLIDVTLIPNRDVDTFGLAIQLERAAPGARLDDHKVWIGRLARLSATVGAIATAIVALIAAAAAATVVFATRTGLAVHQSVIEVLHIIGARDSYIARQFQGHAMSLALRGGILGLFLAGLTLGLLGGLAGQLEGPLLPQLTLTPELWGGLAALPLGASVIATVTARLTVLQALRRMP